MKSGSWIEWLTGRSRYGSSGSARRPATTGMHSIEGLEPRIVPANTSPTAVAAIFVTLEDKPLKGMLSGTDPDGDSLTYSLGALQPAHGKVTVGSDGKFQYIPAINFHGTDSFSFFVKDGTANSVPAVVTIDVASINDVPTVDTGFANPDEDLAFPGSVVPFVNDADLDTLTYSVVTAPAHGTLTMNANGSFTYTSAANYNGPDSFTFRANDGQVNSAVATFNLTVSPVDDALKVTFPSGTPQVARTNTPVRIDPAASVTDIDSVVDYSKTYIRTTIFAGNTNGDNSFGRVFLTLQSQGNGPGQVLVDGSKVYFNGSPVPIATVSGGTLGRALLIQFTSAATQQSVNAVLRQISVQASNKATLGNRSLQITVTAGKLNASATKTVAIV